MAKAPKPWKLTETETFTSFTNWQSNLSYVLSQETNFVPFLAPDMTWSKASTANRGLQAVTTGGNQLSAAQRNAHLQQMLGLIAQWVPTFLTNDIVKSSTSMADVWNFIRKYYGFQQSEVTFMKFSSITWEEGERPERLYQRVLAHLQDNLLQKDGKLKHDGVDVTADEVISPTVERLAVLRWMELLHPQLPQLVQRTFACDLQRMTLKDLQPQIVDALEGFLAELKAGEVSSARINFQREFRGKRRPFAGHSRQPSHPRSSQPRQSSTTPFCKICRANGRAHDHKLADCDHITPYDKRRLLSSRACAVTDHDEDDLVEELDAFDDLALDEDDA